MYCSRDYNFTSRFNQQYEKSTSNKEPCLPHHLSVANTYTEMMTWNRHVAIVIKNQTAVLIIISKGIKVAWVVAVNRVPPVEVMPGTLEKIDEMQGVQ